MPMVALGVVQVLTSLFTRVGGR